MVFPEDRLGLTPGFLTLLYSFFVAVNVALTDSVRERTSRLRHLLLANGLAIAPYNLAFLTIELLLVLVISVVSLLLSLLGKHNSWTFYFDSVPMWKLLYFLPGFGLSYLTLVLALGLLSGDPFDILLLNMSALAVLFIIFAT